MPPKATRGLTTTAPVASAPAFSLADLGRVFQQEYPNDFGPDTDLFELGRVVAEVHPELGKLVSPVATAARDLGVDVAPRVNLQGGPVDAELPGVARSVVANATSRFNALMAPAQKPRLSPTQTPPITPMTLGEQLADAPSALRRQTVGAAAGIAGSLASAASGVLGRVVPNAAARGALGGITETANALQAGIAAEEEQLGIEPWQSPSWYIGQAGQVIGSVAGLAAAGGKWPATFAESAVEAGAVYDATRRDPAKSEGDALIDGSLAFIGNVAVLSATNIPVLEPVGKALRRVLMGAGSEGLQEATQQIISNLLEGKDWSEGLPESAFVGGAAGGTFAGARMGERTAGGVANLLPTPPTSLVQKLAGRSLDAILREGVAAGVESSADPGRTKAAVQAVKAATATPGAQMQAVTAPLTAAEAAGGAEGVSSELSPLDAPLPGTTPLLAGDARPPVPPQAPREPTAPRPPTAPRAPRAPRAPTAPTLPETEVFAPTPASYAARLQALQAALSRGELVTGWDAQGAPQLAPYREAAPAERAFTATPEVPTYAPPTEAIPLDALDSQTLGTLRRVRSELQQAVEIGQTAGTTALPTLADTMPRFLRQLTGLDEDGVITTAPEEIIDALDGLLEEDRPSPLTDRVIEAVRDWQAGLDVPAVGTGVLEPSWAEEQRAFDTRAAMDRPGEMFSEQDRAEGLRQALSERAARLTRPTRARVTVEVPTANAKRFRKQTVELTGRALERFRAEEQRVRELSLPTRESRAALRRAAGVLTEEERAQEAAERAQVTPAERARERQQQLRERERRLATVGVFSRPATWPRLVADARAQGYQGSSDALLMAYHTIAEDRRARAEVEADVRSDEAARTQADPQALFVAIAKAGGLTERAGGNEGELKWWWEHAPDGFAKEAKRSFVGKPRVDKQGRLIARTRKQRVRASLADVPGVLQREGGKTLDAMAETLRQTPGFESIDGPNALLDAMSDAWHRYQTGDARAATTTDWFTGKWWVPVLGETGRADDVAVGAGAEDVPAWVFEDDGAETAGAEATSTSASTTPDITPDPHAPLGSPERTAAHREAIRSTLGGFLNEAGSFNLEKAPKLLSEIVQYAASLTVGGTRNFTQWSKAMRARYSWLHRRQLEAIWQALKTAGWKAKAATTALMAPTTATEVGAMAVTRIGQAFGRGAPPTTAGATIGGMQQFTAHLGAILDLVDWHKIFRVAGNTDPRFRINRQVAEQILQGEEFDPLVSEILGEDASREALAHYFTAMMTEAGRLIGTLGNAVSGHWDAIEHLSETFATRDADDPSVSSLSPRAPADAWMPYNATNRRTLPDGREVVDVGGQTYAVEALKAAQAKFEDALEAIVLQQVEGQLPASFAELLGRRMSGLARGETLGAGPAPIFNAVIEAFREAAVAELTRATSDPLIDRVAGNAGFQAKLTLAQTLRKHVGSPFSSVLHLSTAMMLSQAATAMRNLTTAGYFIPMHVISHGLAGAFAQVSARATANPDIARVRRDAARAHKSMAKQLARSYVDLYAGLRHPGTPWGETLDEVFQLKASLAQAGLKPKDANAVIYLFRDVPSVTHEFLSYVGTQEDIDTQRAYRTVRTIARVAGTFNRWQEFAVRKAVAHASLRAQFQQRGLDFDRFVADLTATQAAAALAGDPSANSTLQPGVLAAYTLTPGDYQTMLEHAATDALQLTFAGRAIPGGIQEAWTSLFNTPGAGDLLRLVIPFPRFIGNAAAILYDHTLAALVELPLYAASRGLSEAEGVVRSQTAATLKFAGRALGSVRLEEAGGKIRQFGPREIGRKARGRLARAIEAETLRYTGVPGAERAVQTQLLGLKSVRQQLAQMKQTWRAEQAAELRALRKFADQLAAHAKSQSMLPTPTWTPPPRTVSKAMLVSQLQLELETRKTLRALRKDEATYQTRLKALDRGGAGDRYFTYAKAATGASFLSLALLLKTLSDGGDDEPWYRVALPWLPATVDGKQSELDLRSYPFLVHAGLLADFVTDVATKTSWAGVSADLERLERDDPTSSAASRWAQAIRINYGGKYRQQAAMRAFADAFLGITRQTPAQGALVDLLFGQTPEGDLGSLTDALFQLSGALLSRFTVPGRMVVDLVGAVSEEERVQRLAPLRPSEGIGAKEIVGGAMLENVPGVRRVLPETVDQITGETRTSPRPLAHFFGLTITERSPLQRQFEAMGMTNQEMGLRRTYIPAVDNALAREYSSLLKEILPDVLSDPWYTALSRNEQRQYLTGTVTRDAEGRRLTLPGVLPPIKQAAIGLTMGQSPEMAEALTEGKASARQAADFERWVRALVGEAEWLKEAHGIDMFEAEEEEPADEFSLGDESVGGVSGAAVAPGSLAGTPPPRE